MPELSEIAAQYRRITDFELTELHAQGRSAFATEAVWTALEAELARRGVLDRARAALPLPTTPGITRPWPDSLAPIAVPLGLHANEYAALLAAIIRPNWSEHYGGAFAQFADGGQRWHWNWAAGLMRGWAWYRRLYPVAIGMTGFYVLIAGGVYLLLSLLRGTPDLSDGTVLAALAGAVVATAVWRGGYGDYLMWERATEIIAEAAKLPDAATRLAYVQRRGGVRVTYYAIAAILLTIRIIIV